MKARIPNAELVMLAPGNHQTLPERPKEVNEAADRFIKKLSANKVSTLSKRTQIVQIDW